MINTDHLLWMVRRRVADLWRKAAEEADAQRVNYERLYQQLLGELSALASDGTEAEHATCQITHFPFFEERAQFPGGKWL